MNLNPKNWKLFRCKFCNKKVSYNDSYITIDSDIILGLRMCKECMGIENEEM